MGNYKRVHDPASLTSRQDHDRIQVDLRNVLASGECIGGQTLEAVHKTRDIVRLG